MQHVLDDVRPIGVVRVGQGDVAALGPGQNLAQGVVGRRVARVDRRELNIMTRKSEQRISVMYVCSSNRKYARNSRRESENDHYVIHKTEH